MAPDELHKGRTRKAAGSRGEGRPLGEAAADAALG